MIKWQRLQSFNVHMCILYINMKLIKIASRIDHVSYPAKITFLTNTHYFKIVDQMIFFVAVVWNCSVVAVLDARASSFDCYIYRSVDSDLDLDLDADTDVPVLPLMIMGIVIKAKFNKFDIQTFERERNKCTKIGILFARLPS